MIWHKLICAPFRFDELEVMPQSVSERTGKALPVLYFDARCVRRRLDQVLTPHGWDFTIAPITLGGKAGIIGTLKVYPPEGGIIERQEVSEVSDIEALKGAASGALKRCFSSLGNDTLYSVDLPWFEGKFYESNGKRKFDGFTPESLRAIRAVYEKQYPPVATSDDPFGGLGFTKHEAKALEILGFTLPDAQGVTTAGEYLRWVMSQRQAQPEPANPQVEAAGKAKKADAPT